MTRRRAVAALSSVAVILAACGGGHQPMGRPAPVAEPATTTSTAVTTAPSVTATTLKSEPLARISIAGVGLTPFTGCPELLVNVRAQALARVQPWGLPDAGVGTGSMGIAGGGASAGGASAMSAGAAGSGTAGATGGSASGPTPDAAGFSSTNNQEAGVDEPDLAKTDGRLLVTLRQRGAVVQVADIEGSPRLRGSVTLPQQFNSELGLFLVGHDAVVLGQAFDAGSASPGPRTEVWVVNLTNPDHPVISRTFSVDGTETAARLLGRSIKLVVTSAPRLAFTPPRSGSVEDQQAALRANKAVIAAAPVSAWVPSVIDGADRRRPGDCALVSHTAAPAGLGTTSVVSIDPDLPEPSRAVTVLGDPEVVYASSTDLYVATGSAGNGPVPAATVGGPPAGTAQSPVPGVTTQVHDFDITGPAEAVYAGSGVVPGTVLNQYSMSEDGGYLRVATTVGAPAPPPNEGAPVATGDLSQSYVTVLGRRNGNLVQVGQVGGLGQGQKIYGVRFIGTLGYVVTFRQLDPLYVVDLSDPADPVIRGALELTGYSAYLHPIAAGLVLGVGESADANARRTGLQISLFDVTSSAHPRLVGQDQIGQGSSPVEQDPHAFMWWAPAHLAVVPVQTWCTEACGGSVGGGSTFNGAVALRVEAGGVVEIGRLTHGGRGGGTQGTAGIERALVVGPLLYTVSDQGLLASNLSTLRDVSWLPY